MDDPFTASYPGCLEEKDILFYVWKSGHKAILITSLYYLVHILCMAYIPSVNANSRQHDFKTG